MPVAEVLEFLKSGKIKPTDFDALICSSGSEMYYPGTPQCTGKDGQLCPESDYAFHIDYRWGNDGLKKTVVKLFSSQDPKDNKAGNAQVQEDTKSCNSRCASYVVKNPSTAKRVDDLRQKLRMRGLRCHPIYCRNSTRLQIVPLLASRSQALRYLFVRWGLNVANMYVILGETGDTDYEELFAGSHKTVILKDAVEKGSEELLRTAGSYQRHDIVPQESPLVAYVNHTTASEISNALKAVSRSLSR
ncbi:sporulation-specific protein 2 [Asimina triloba]